MAMLNAEASTMAVPGANPTNNAATDISAQSTFVGFLRLVRSVFMTRNDFYLGR